MTAKVLTLKNLRASKFDRKEKLVSGFSMTRFDVLIASNIHLQHGLVSNND